MSDWESPKAFIVRTGNALLRIAAMALLGAAHWLLEQGVPYVLPENLQSGRLWVQDVSFCAFMCIYAYLLWDMIQVFVPAGKKQPNPRTKAKK